ncbi:MAG: hypothetical protein JJ896_06520 [Rhodothermales bacterium]|nr:hypothetical protein [Rhodothermales bacterium]MBO6779289.1 hypothetical protein [Rhodothermales bacterium]
MNINWLYVGLAAFAVYAVIFGRALKKKALTRTGLAVGLGNMLYVVLNLVAPFRGVLDPSYAGYRAGVFDISPGWMVTLVSGSIVVLALTGACLAVRGGRGRRMVLLAAVQVFLLGTIGIPEMISVMADIDQYVIELGEYLRIPGAVAGGLVIGLLVAPPALGLVWSLRRISPESGTVSSS